MFQGRNYSLSVFVCLIFLFGLLHACSGENQQPIRIASNVWPGYEMIFLAREKGFFNEKNIRLVEVPSATVCIQALEAGNVEGAMLTLDEVLTARATGLDLVIVAVLDVSLGADVLLVKPDIKNLAQLKGKRIGVEQSAVGAVMLDAALAEAKLNVKDVQIVYLTVNQHEKAYGENKVDALVSFEPVSSKLLSAGAIKLYDSSRIPGRIVDVLAVLPKVVRNNPKVIHELVRSHFKARDYFLANPQEASVTLAKRLQIPPSEVPASFIGLELTDTQENLLLLGGESPRLKDSAKNLMQIMIDAQLLPRELKLDTIISDKFI